MSEEIRKNLDKGRFSGMLLTDLSKAFDCLVHDLLIVKLNAYGSDYNALSLINNYLSETKQRTKIGDAFSKWTDIILEFPNDLSLGHFYLIFISMMFYFSDATTITNYADDNTPYASDTVDLVISRLEKDSSNLSNWFKFNYLKSNEDKCQLLLNVDYPDLSIKVGNDIVHNSTQVKLLGIVFDTALNFDAHVSKLCKKANQTFHALLRVSKYTSNGKLRIVMNSFIISQFGYCPLVWMFHSRGVNNRINKIHKRTLRLVYKDDKSTFDERTLRLVYKDDKSTYEELLMKDNSFTIHDRNLQVLVTEIYKVINNISPVTTKSIFKIKNTPYNLRSGVN